MISDKENASMDVIIENCRSIDRASISIEPASLTLSLHLTARGNRVLRRLLSLLRKILRTLASSLSNGLKKVQLKSTPSP